MTERVRFRPFTGDPNTRVRLDRAPLELVLCQIRWPELGYLQGNSLEPLAQRLGAQLTDYPIFTSVPELNFAITPAGVTSSEGSTVYQWTSIDKMSSVSLGRTFLSVYTRSYTDYPAFASEVEKVLRLLQEILNVQVIERVGVRYLNRISRPDLMSRIGELVKPPVLGYQGLDLPGGDVELVQALNQAQIRVDDGMLQVRSGVVPPGQTIDPSVPPVNSPSWILDIDSSSEISAAFDIPDVVARAGRLSDSAYDFFKYVIKNGFVEEFGGGSTDADL